MATPLELEDGLVSIFPNPVIRNGAVIVDNRTKEQLRFSLFNSEGKLIRSQTIASESVFQFQPDQAGGVYTYSLQGTEFIQNGSLVVVQ